MSPPSWISLPPSTLSYPSRSSQSTRLGCLCYIAASLQLSVLRMLICVSKRSFLSSSHPLLPPLCPPVCSLYLHLSSCPANRVMSTVLLVCFLVLWKFTLNVNIFWQVLPATCLCYSSGEKQGGAVYIQGESLVLTHAWTVLEVNDFRCVDVSGWRLSVCYLVHLTFAPRFMSKYERSD